MSKYIKAGLVAISLSALMAAGTVAPAYADTSRESAEKVAAAPSGVAAENQVIAELRQKLASAANTGDAAATSSLAALDVLGKDKKSELARIILGEGVVQASQRAGSGVQVRRTGDCTSPAARASGMFSIQSTYSVTANCDADFSFAGVSVTKVRLTGSYVTGSGVVLSTSNATAYVMHSYEPGSSVSFSNFSHSASGGRGQFQTTATVTRSLFGWTHSTRSGNLRLVTSGPGVVSCGWV